VSLDYARDLWDRAHNALQSAETLLLVSADDAASRTYYAAFHAVSAAFALLGRTFTSHRALRAAVHRDWVKQGLWTPELGADFDALWELRDLGDYGGTGHVDVEDATAAVAAARRILEVLRAQHPELEAPQGTGL
jgi:uncharacterized protein (UPF0332 family)